MRLSLRPLLSFLSFFLFSVSCFLSVRVSLSPVHHNVHPPVGPWIRVGRAVLDPRRGPGTAGVVLALGLGRGPVAVTAFGAWWRGAARPGGGRHSRATCMPEACGLASEWRMVTWGHAWGATVGRTTAWCGFSTRAWETSIMNCIVACTLKEGHKQKQFFLQTCRR